MKFGKQIQAEQVPGWSQYYLDYKFLKKIISSLADKRPATEAASLALGVRPGDLLETPLGTPSPKEPPWRSPHAFDSIGGAPRPILVTQSAEDKDPGMQAHKAAFFFKLERELERINTFYLRKEAEYKLRLEKLLAQRRAAAMRVLPDADDDNDNVHNHVEWNVVEEGFRQLERDLSKLQHFVELNATGFRKILKKWDKRSKSTTKELYLARQVDVQPVFNRQLISELADTVAACLLDITDLSAGLKVEKPGVNDLIFSHQIATERSSHTGPFHALEGDLRKAVAAADQPAIRDIVKYSDTLASQQWGSANVNRILWKAVIDAPPNLADLILSCPAKRFDFHFIDDVSGRTCLHEAVMANAPRLVDICLKEGVQREKLDDYGRSAVHYSCLSPSVPDSEADLVSARICQTLLEAGLAPDILDLDNYSPLLYAVLRGSVNRVRVLLDVGHVHAAGTASSGDLLPLSLACQAGNSDVATLLLERGAVCRANTNGEFPMHLAAREGHVEVCRILVGREGWDSPDKYNDWTPLFHAARNGRDACLQVLLDAGSQVGVTDEFGNCAIYYAAWNGHRGCVDLLLRVMASIAPKMVIPSTQLVSPLALSQPAAAMSVDDLELIPSLALPPPIMPYRVYGHNFLDKTCLVQVILGSRLQLANGERASDAVRLHPKLSGMQSRDRYMHESPFLKLVITPGPDSTSAPYSVPLPLPPGRHVYTFQVPAVDHPSLEFTLFPHNGTKNVGRAVALPTLLRDAVAGHPIGVPLLDHRLHVIGEIFFEVNVIRPFTGVTLEIGGGVETYWKSLTVSANGQPGRAGASLSNAVTGSASAATSPSNYGMSPSGRAATVSSITGTYVHAVVQLTRDNHPVVFSGRRLPIDDVDVSVSGVTLAQFEAVGKRRSLWLDATTAGRTESIDGRMITLDSLLKMLPPQTGVCLELAIAAATDDTYSVQTTQLITTFSDSVLRTIYRTLDGAGRRRIVLTSFSPDLCASLNWKQPNYPVFLSSLCGAKEVHLATPGASAVAIRPDRRSATIAAAIEFAKANNILGVLLDAELLAKVPMVIQGIKDTGLLVGTFGTPEQTAVLSASSTEIAGVDAVLGDGMLTCVEHSMRALI